MITPVTTAALDRYNAARENIAFALRHCLSTSLTIGETAAVTLESIETLAALQRDLCEATLRREPWPTIFGLLIQSCDRRERLLGHAEALRARMARA